MITPDNYIYSGDCRLMIKAGAGNQGKYPLVIIKTKNLPNLSFIG